MDWQRRVALRGAVESVLASYYPREEYEIIVVKGYKDPAIDDWLDAMDVRRIEDPNAVTGQMHTHGLKVARGDVVAWLDDDDRFVPEKLDKVAARFKGSNIAYYHHGQMRTDPSGKIIGRGPSIPDFNCSSIVVRREDCLKIADGLAKLNGVCDSFLCYGIMALGRPQSFDDEPLTLYASTTSVGRHLYVPLLQNYLDAVREVKRLGRGRMARRAAASLLSLYFSALARSRVDMRRGAAWALIEAAKTLEVKPYLPNMREVWFSFIHPFAPPLAWKAYSMFRHGDVDWLK
jgi:glycosyltransferase involved in cell wall biosynthesis